MTIISSVTFSILVQSVSQSKNLMIKQRKKRICVTNKNKKLILKVTNLVCHVNFEMCVCRGMPKHYSVCPSINWYVLCVYGGLNKSLNSLNWHLFAFACLFATPVTNKHRYSENRISGLYIQDSIRNSFFLSLLDQCFVCDDRSLYSLCLLFVCCC